MHCKDYWETIRRWTLPKIGRLVAEVNETMGTDLYVTSVTNRDEFSCFVPQSEEELEERLHEMGFVRNPVAAWKRIFYDSNIYEGGSYALRGHWDGEMFHIYPWGDYQLHAIIYELDGDDTTTAVFAHYEYSWVTHPIKHYRAHGVPYKGEGPEIMRQLLSRNGATVSDSTINVERL